VKGWWEKVEEGIMICRPAMPGGPTRGKVDGRRWKKKKA